MPLLRKFTARWWPFTVVVGVAVGGGFSACTPNSGVTVDESDVVVTLYDKQVDFLAIQTYRLPDTVVHLTGDPDKPDDPNITRKYDRDIINRVRANLNDRGFQEVSEGSDSDVEVLVQATSLEFWNLYSYGGWGGYWGWWPGWGGCCWNPWYPPVGASYSFTTGTLIVDMVDEDNISEDGKTIPVYWTGAANGVLDDTDRNVASRFGRSIDQMFIQSPYLRSGAGGGN